MSNQMLTIEVKLDPSLAGLPPGSRMVKTAASGCLDRYVRQVTLPTTVKDFLEAAGIPHCEIGSITAAGHPLGLDHLLTYDISLAVVSTQPHPLDDVRFICDQHLGTLARLLRMMGFDTTWERDWLEPELARRAVNEDRVVLSRNRSLLKRKALTQALLIRGNRPDDQAAEVLHRFLLAGQIQMFNRCTACNGLVEPVSKAKVRDRIPPRTKLWLDDYFLCRDCDNLYWEGTHVTAIRQRVAAIIQRANLFSR